MKHATMMAAMKIEGDLSTLRPERRALDPILAELCGARLMAALGIGHAYCKPVSREDALKLDPQQWIIKSVAADDTFHACFSSGEFATSVLAVAKVSGAIPVSYLRTRYGIDGGYPVINADEWGTGTYRMNGVIFKGKPNPFISEEFYSSFIPPTDWSAVKIAIAWNSLEMLKIHAARLFLGCTTAHASNILIDSAARLYSIDHADIAKTDGEEIDLLFQNVKPGTRAFEALRPICTLSEVDMGIFGEAAGYYLDRLRKWKDFSQKPRFARHKRFTPTAPRAYKRRQCVVPIVTTPEPKSSTQERKIPSFGDGANASSAAGNSALRSV